MKNFQTGDRVVVAGRPATGSAVEGQVGTVIEDSREPWIRFDRPVGREYTNFGNISGWRSGYMECMPNHYLEHYDGPAEKRPVHFIHWTTVVAGGFAAAFVAAAIVPMPYTAWAVLTAFILVSGLLYWLVDLDRPN